MQIVQAVMLKYAELYRKRYNANWVPTSENIRETLEKIKPPLEGFQGLTKDDLLTRLDVYFNKKDDWIVTTKHNYHVFIAHIHRWLPTHHTLQAQNPGTYFCDCGNELQINEICEKCFPHCSNCGCQHSPDETCEEFLERDTKIRKSLFGNDKRTGKIQPLKEYFQLNNK